MERSFRILIADDPADWARRFLEELHSSSTGLFLALDQRQGWEVLRRQRVDLAVIAGDNPRIGGLELARRVHQVRGEVPVIVLSSGVNARVLRESLRIGARTVLPKPVNIDRLVHVSMKILGF